MKYLIDYVRGYLTKNEGNIEPVWNMADSDFESDFEESLLFLLFKIDYLLCSATLILNSHVHIVSLGDVLVLNAKLSILIGRGN